MIEIQYLTLKKLFGGKNSNLTQITYTDGITHILGDFFEEFFFPRLLVRIFTGNRKWIAYKHRWSYSNSIIKITEKAVWEKNKNVYDRHASKKIKVIHEKHPKLTKLILHIQTFFIHTHEYIFYSHPRTKTLSTPKNICLNVPYFFCILVYYLSGTICIGNW